MTFGEAIATCFKKYADFTGRAARAEYWWFTLFIFLASIGMAIVSETLAALFSLGTTLPCLAVVTRRLHDTDRSGWWQLLWLVPLLGWIPLLIWATQKGKAEPNRFGDAPAS